MLLQYLPLYVYISICSCLRMEKLKLNHINESTRQLLENVTPIKKKKKPFNTKIYKNDTNLSTEYWKLSNLTHANPGV